MTPSDHLHVSHINEIRQRVDDLSCIAGLDGVDINSPEEGDVLRYNGTDWENAPLDVQDIMSAGGVPFSKGDILTATMAGVLQRMGIGVNGHALLADDSQTLGMRWGSVSGGSGDRVYDCMVGASESDYTTVGAAYADGKRVIFVKKGTYNESALVVGADDAYIVGESRTQTVINIGNNTWEFAAERGNLSNLCLNIGSTGKLYITGKRNTFTGNTMNIAPTSNVAIHAPSGAQYNLFSGNQVFDTGTTTVSIKVSFEGDRNLTTGNFFKMNPTVTAGAINVGDLNNFIGNYVYAATTGTGAFVRSGGVNMIVGNFINGRTDQVSNVSLECIGILTHSGSQHTQIKDNNVYNCYDTAIKLVSSGELQCHNNFLDYCDIGIDMVNVSDSQVTGNFMAYQTTKASPVKVGIRMQSCLDCTVDGGYIVNFDPNISLDGSCRRNSVQDVRMNVVTTDILDNGYATHIRDNKTGQHSNNKTQVKYKNTSGGTLDTGTVVVLKSVAAGNEINTTTSADDANVLGVISDISTGNNAWGLVQVEGKIAQVKVNGTTDIAIGDFLSTYTEAGIAQKAGSGATVFAKALGAYTANDSNGLIPVLLISPRKI